MAASGVIVSAPRRARRASNTAGWTIPPAVAPLGVDATTYDAVEPATRGEHARAAEGTCSSRAATTRRGATASRTVFRTLALLAPRHANLHVVVFGPGSLDDELAHARRPRSASARS